MTEALDESDVALLQLDLQVLEVYAHGLGRALLWTCLTTVTVVLVGGLLTSGPPGTSASTLAGALIVVGSLMAFWAGKGLARRAAHLARTRPGDFAVAAAGLGFWRQGEGADAGMRALLRHQLGREQSPDCPPGMSLGEYRTRKGAALMRLRAAQLCGGFGVVAWLLVALFWAAGAGGAQHTGVGVLAGVVVLVPLGCAIAAGFLAEWDVRGHELAKLTGHESLDEWMAEAGWRRHWVLLWTPTRGAGRAGESHGG